MIPKVIVVGKNQLVLIYVGRVYETVNDFLLVIRIVNISVLIFSDSAYS